jgi:ribosomal 50S subunit-recycling heat shock protein
MSNTNSTPLTVQHASAPAPAHAHAHAPAPSTTIKVGDRLTLVTPSAILTLEIVRLKKREDPKDFLLETETQHGIKKRPDSS